jgi:hypothetical protein
MLTPFRNYLLVTLLHVLAVAGSTIAPARAQKVQDEVVAVTFNKAPLLNLKPRYATYSVEYDLGSLAMNTPAPPALQGITYQKAGGDLLLRITAKGVYVADRALQEGTTTDGYWCSYRLTYEGDFGYELHDVKTDEVLARHHHGGGLVATQSFKNVRDLNSYVDNAFVGEHTRRELTGTLRLVNFVLNPHQYQTQLTLNTVAGEAPAYADINKATADFKALLAAPEATRLAALGSAWQQQLTRADWDNKKSDINKKVAGALLENLCALALLTNDYAGMARYAEAYQQHRVNAFGFPAQFKADMSYTGTAVPPPATTVLGRALNKTMRVSYAELATDMRPAAAH